MERTPVSYSVETDRIEVTSMGPTYKPDPEWSFTDAFGHTHTWERKTWKWVYDGAEYWFDADGDERNGDGDHRCLVCDAVVDPGYVIERPAGERHWISGMAHYTVTYSDGHSEEVDEARFQELRRAVVAS